MTVEAENPVTVSGAVTELQHAVAALVDEQTATFQGAARISPSLYGLLREELAASCGIGEKLAKLHAGSKPTVWVDALDLLNEMDTAVAVWHPGGDSTPARLRALAARPWRPQDVRGISQITEAVRGWAKAAAALLDPPATREVMAACPRCNVRHTYRQRAGERVRQAALQVSAEGCVCMACGASWPPPEFEHLVRLLGVVSPRAASPVVGVPVD